jgi:internalin A
LDGNAGRHQFPEGLSKIYYLRKLSLTSQSIADLSPLTGIKLEKICLADNYIGNLLPLKDLVTLTDMDVCQNPLRDLTPISRLLSLEALDISQPQVTDLKPLAGLTKAAKVEFSLLRHQRHQRVGKAAEPARD